ncbi:MAG: hypothetical protein GC200_11260 [Tepidisphaera sp.]|nr:hypothetical protein [Tepidisphaera sp.]
MASRANKPVMQGPIFIGGAPRSGTTALWNALTKHPALMPREGYGRTDKELWFFAEFFAGRSRRDIGRRTHPLDQEFAKEAVQFIDGFMRWHCAAPGGRYIAALVDNILYTEEILRLLPDARMLLMVRHPQENVWSLLNAFFSGFIRKAKGADLITDEEIGKAVEIWRERAAIVLKAMEGEYGPRVMVVRQERFIIEPEAVSRQMLEFLGEEYHPGVAAALSQGVINTSFPPDKEPSEKSFMEVVPVMAPGEREAFFARTRAELIAHPRVCRVVREMVGSEMRQLGYEDLTDLGGAAAPAPAKVRAGEIVQISVVPNRPSFAVDDLVTVRVVVQANQNISHPSVSYVIHDELGERLFGTTTFDERVRLPDMPAGTQQTVEFAFPARLRVGLYKVSASFNSVSLPGYVDNVLHHQVEHAAEFRVHFTEGHPVHYRFSVPAEIRSFVHSEQGTPAAG